MPRSRSCRSSLQVSAPCSRAPAIAVALGSNSIAYVLGSLWPALPPDRVVAGSFRLTALVLWFGLVVLVGNAPDGQDPSPAPPRRFLLLAGWMVLLAATAGAERYGFF